MTREIRRTSRFKKDYRRERKSHADLEQRLRTVIQCLIDSRPLPSHLKDHPLSGNWSDHRDCHIKPDLILIYKLDGDCLTLVRIGSHSELF